jgi:hypothetical protein
MAVFLSLTAAVSLIWSNIKLMWNDELLVLWTDKVPGLEQLVRIQRFYPISLDPLFYHLAGHGAIRAFGANAFAIRLPSLLGFLIMQLCLFIFVRRIAGERAGIIALAFPAITPAFYYAVEGRPYGMMLGLIGIAMVSWQIAASRESSRIAALAALALAIFLTLNTHYFGCLLLIPLLAAEGWRTLQRRKFDVPILAAMALGTLLGILLVLPFIHGASEFRAHIWDPKVEPRRILAIYTMALPTWLDPGPRTYFVFLFQVLLALVPCYFLLRYWRAALRQHDGVFLVMLGALPFFGFLLARFVTHTFEPRYSIGALIGVSGVVAIGFQPILARPSKQRAAFAAVLLMTLALGTKHIVDQISITRGEKAVLIMAPELKATLKATPGQPIYIQNPHTFAYVSYYEPDPELRSRLAFVYSRDLELRLLGRDTNALSAINLTHFSDLKIDSFESLSSHPGTRLFVLSEGDFYNDWITSALAERGARVQPQGKAFGGIAASVSF